MVRKTLKNKKRAGMWPFSNAANAIAGDDELVKITTGGKDVVCSICDNADFQRRRATFGKSKLYNFSTNLILDDDALLDISVICYFCNNCGNCITVRDPKTTSESAYKNLIVSTNVN